MSFNLNYSANKFGAKGFNPLKSGQCLLISNFNGLTLAVEVSIPLNRVNVF